MGTPNPRPQKTTVTIGVKKVTIYAKLNELGFFLGGLTADTAPAVVISNQNVRSHTRRRYPGGPAQSVDAHARSRVFEQARPEQTLPGQNAWLEQTTGGGPNATRRIEQFTFVGDFEDLKNYVKAEKNFACILRSPSGVAYDIVDAP